MEASALITGPSIADQAPKLSELERAALQERLRRQKPEDRESLTDAATRALQASDCGCDIPGDYLTRPLESAHRCPNAVAPGSGPRRGRDRTPVVD